jgi:hypothetical protein
MISMTVLMNLIPCGLGMSPFGGVVDIMSLKFFFSEKAVSQSSTKREIQISKSSKSLNELFESFQKFLTLVFSSCV